MARIKIYSSYLHHQENFRDKWKEYQSEKMIFGKANYVPELTPLNGTVDFDQLSVDKRHKLFFEYTKLVAEALILFEQILVYGVRHLYRESDSLDLEARLALHQLAVEELYHSQGFRHFLHSNEVFHWNEKKIYADSKRLKNTLAFIVKKAPACVFLPGAKLEAFTLSYYRMIKKYYPDHSANSWIKINYIHQIDEAFHLPLEFDLHDSLIQKAGHLKTVIGAIFFVLIMQVALIIGSYKIINNVFPESGPFKKIRWMMKMAKWAVRTTPAYQEARQMTKQQFEKKRPKWGRVFAFIYW
ncbi:MAG: hypothetical protein ACXVLQ_16135 [Bacteriovorax sp.]